jgi:acyl-CoA synthetase (AMP-forming)/AMP-acid ligase II
MIKRKYNKKNFLNEFNLEIDDDDEYYLFKTSGSEGNQKNVLIKVERFIKNFQKYIEALQLDLNKKILITSKMNVEHPYAFGLYEVLNNLIFYESIKNKIEELKNVDVIFSTPSFFINFKDFIKINKNQKIIFTGEEIPNSLKTELKDFDVYQSFGMTESLNVGLKKMIDNSYSFIDETITINNNYIHSPYLCSYILENNQLKKIEDRYQLSDRVSINGNKFSFLERESEIAKINEEKISLKMISNFLFLSKKIKDIVIFKTKKNDLDEINLFYVSDLNKKNIEDMLLTYFNNNNYIPRYIYQVDNIPITDLGKKDISRLINEYKK